LKVAGVAVFAVTCSGLCAAQTTTLEAVADTYLKSGSANSNVGTETLLRIQASGNNRTLVRFDSAAIATAVGRGSLASAKLQLYVQNNSDNWGTAGRSVDALRVTVDWTEAGATWNCGIDTIPTNSQPNCATQWAGGAFAEEPSDTVLQTNGTTGWVTFDVTADVLSFLSGTANDGWIVKKSDESQSGQVDYTSRQGTAGQHPRLVLAVESAASDAIPPRVALTAPSTPYLVNQPQPTITVETSDGGSGVDVSSVDVLIDGTSIRSSCSVTATGAQCASPALAAGAHAVHAMARDLAGNLGSADASFTLLLGNGPHVTTFDAVGDTYLRGGSANQSQGSASVLEVQSSGHHRALVQFDATQMQSTLAGATLRSATLQLYVQSNGRNWGSTGRTVESHRLTTAWQESSATWNCPSDGNLTNSQPDCATQWAGGAFAATPSATVLHTNALQGWVSYDVTSDVAAFLAGAGNYGWLLKKTDEGASGRIDYVSREGAAGQRPRLVVIFETPSTQDTTPPTISALSPANGAFIARGTPTLSASYSDGGSGIDVSSARIYIDGVVTSGATASALSVSVEPTPALADGAHTVRFEVKDVAGNSAQASTIFTVDTARPSVASIVPATGAFVASAQPTISAALSDAGSGVDSSAMRASVDGSDVTAAASISPSAFTFHPTFLDVGSHAVHLVVPDRAGNVATADWNFVVDFVAPELVITSPTEPVVDEASPTIAVTYSDGVSGVDSSSFRLTVDGSDVSSHCAIGAGSATCTPASGLANGGHVVNATVSDRAGNHATAALSFEVDLDHEPPHVAITSPADGFVTNQAGIDVVGTVSDDTDIASVTVNGQSATVSGSSFLVHLALTEGNTAILAVATDVRDKQSLASVNVTLDTAPPVITVTRPVSSLVNSATTTVAGRVEDNVGLGAVTVAGQVVALTDGSFSSEVTLAQGANAIAVHATDAAGNAADTTVNLTRFTLPSIRITEPADLSYVSAITVRVAGTVSGNVVGVGVNGAQAALAGGSFSLDDVPLIEGGNVITATAVDAAGHQATATINIVRDLEPPHVAIYTPVDGATVFEDKVSVSGLVNDLVPGTVNAAQATVTVNGIAAAVANRSFLATDVPLAPGDNVLVAAATDAQGNRAEAVAHVRRETPTVARIMAQAGGGQAATIGAELVLPLVAKLTDANGLPVAGQGVQFHVIGGDGTLDGGGRLISVLSGPDGTASAHFKLGTHAGEGAQRVDAETVGFEGTATFLVTGLAGPATLIVEDSGDQQLGTTGQQLPRPLIAAVVDAGSNRLPGVPVRFTVVKGGGSLGNGSAEQVVPTDGDGRAIATLVLGPEEGTSNNVVTARIDGQTGGSVVGFTSTAWAAGDPAATAIHGLVVDNVNQPVPGVTVRLRGTTYSAQTDAQGFFRIAPAPVGTLKMIVDGSTATRPGAWPDLEFVITTVSGRDADLGMPIYLLPLNTAGGALIDEQHGGTITLPDFPGFALEIAPGSVTFPGGSRSGVVSVTAVHNDKVPMIPNFGQQPRFIVTIQPAGARFDPPARLTMPNLEGFAPGQVVEMYSFDHDLGHFVSIGAGTVSEDGATVKSNPGVGVVKAGWHCCGLPRETGLPHDCGQCGFCNFNTDLCSPLPFAAPCDDHDVCTVGDSCRGGSCAGDKVTVSVTAPSPCTPNDKVIESHLLPADQSGLFTLTLRGKKDPLVLIREIRHGGNYKDNMDYSHLPEGVEYTDMLATWEVETCAASGVAAFHVESFGVFLHTQYNCPEEADPTCSGPAQEVCTAAPSACLFTKTTMSTRFVDQINGQIAIGSGDTGCGTSINAGKVQEVSGCSPPDPKPTECAFKETFTRVSAFAPGCRGVNSRLGPDTVAAQVVNHRLRPDMPCGTRLCINFPSGPTIKTVTDSCPKCGDHQLDNFSLSPICGLRGDQNALVLKVFP
jgi:hypothetical protein